jgi:hypothetical protein
MSPPSGGASSSATVFRCEPDAPIARALQEGARCELDELTEVGNEVRLVVIARVCGDVYPVLRGRRPRRKVPGAQTAEEAGHVVCEAALSARWDVYTPANGFALVWEYMAKQPG